MKKSPQKNKPTQERIDAEIATLKEIKPRILGSSVFGDNHHDAIDAQILVLEKKMTEYQVDDRSAFEDDEDYEEKLEEGAWKLNVRDAAMDTVHWLNGDEEESPVESWKELVRE